MPNVTKEGAVVKDLDGEILKVYLSHGWELMPEEEPLTCDLCGATGFHGKLALSGHQRSAACKEAREN